MSKHRPVAVSHLLLHTGSLSLSVPLGPSQLVQNRRMDEITLS